MEVIGEAESGPVVSGGALKIKALNSDNTSKPGDRGNTFKVIANHVPIKIPKGPSRYYRCRVDVVNEKGIPLRDIELCRSLAKAWSKMEGSPLYKKPYVYGIPHVCLC